MSMTRPPVTPKKKGDPRSGSPRSVCRSEVERHSRGRGSDGRAADGVVGRVATADLIAMAARAETIMRARSLVELRADDIPAGPVVEVVARANRILAGGIVE